MNFPPDSRGDIDGIATGTVRDRGDLGQRARNIRHRNAIQFSHRSVGVVGIGSDVEAPKHSRCRKPDLAARTPAIGIAQPATGEVGPQPQPDLDGVPREVIRAFSRRRSEIEQATGGADTTGIDTLDYYVSHAECEPADGVGLDAAGRERIVAGRKERAHVAGQAPLVVAHPLMHKF